MAFLCNNNLNLYSCKLCNYTTNLKINFSIHLCGIIDNGDEVMLRECSKCRTTSYSSIWYHYSHLRNCILEKKNESERNSQSNQRVKLLPFSDVYQCDQCHYTSTCRAYFIRHNKRHQNKNLFFNCTKCNRKFKQRCTLKIHIKTKHKKSAKDFKCNNCTFETYYKKDLARHIKTKHSTIEKEFKCDRCDYKTHRSEHFKLHKSTHRV